MLFNLLLPLVRKWAKRGRWCKIYRVACIYGFDKFLVKLLDSTLSKKHKEAYLHYCIDLLQTYERCQFSDKTALKRIHYYKQYRYPYRRL